MQPYSQADPSVSVTENVLKEALRHKILSLPEMRLECMTPPANQRHKVTKMFLIDGSSVPLRRMRRHMGKQGGNQAAFPNAHDGARG